MARRLAVGLMVAMATASAPALFAQARDYCLPIARQTATSAAAYAERTGGYCDGAVFQPNAGSGELAVIGVMTAPLEGDPAKRPLRVTVMPVPGTIRDAVWPVRLQGVAASPEINYRLDAVLTAPNRPLIVGSESAMTRMSLTAEKISWLAWYETSTHGPVYVPVAGRGSTNGNVTVTVRPTLKAAYLVHTIKSADGTVLTPWTESPGHAKRGLPIAITVPAGEPRLVVMEIKAVSRQGDIQVCSLRLVRPGA